MIVENIVTNLYAKFNEDRLKNGKVLGNGKSDNNNPKNNNNNNNNNKNNIHSLWGLVPRSKNMFWYGNITST